MIYKNVKLYQITYQKLDKIRSMIQITQGITVNKSQIMDMAINNMIRLLATKINSKDDDGR